MTDDGQIIWESDFKIIDKDELENIKKEWNIDDKWWNLRDDLIKLWFLDYDKLSEEEKIIFDELKKEERGDFYELD